VKGQRNRLPAIGCPHCGSRAIVRSSEQETLLSRELRLRCDNDACGHQFVAQLLILRTIVPSMSPNTEIRLPFGNPNLRGARKRPANDDVPIPANDGEPLPKGGDMIRSG
jgi:predicted RNA-binding Zn-ribbon protein involved in translation (DUF1610 family)